MADCSARARAALEPALASRAPSVVRAGLLRRACVVATALVLAACGTTGSGGGPAKRGGGYYQDDGPGAAEPADLAAIPDAQPRDEPLVDRANRPYVVFGRRYEPMRAREPYRERGVASWYGRKFHGRATSIGEPYDMYAMTAAHKTLPLPSYVRVTNLANGNSVVVRVNDRGPFLQGRLIDLSWTAAAKLGYVNDGHARVEVEVIDPLAPDATPRLASRSWGADARSAGVDAVTVPSTAVVPVVAAVERPSDVSQASAAAGRDATQGATRPDATAGTGQVTAREREQVAAIFADRLATGSGGAEAGSVGAAAASAAVDEPPRTVTAAPTYYVQLAAFNSIDGAHVARARLAARFDWLADRLVVHADGARARLQAGPYVDRSAALAVAERVRAGSSLKPFPVRR